MSSPVRLSGSSTPVDWRGARSDLSQRPNSEESSMGIELFKYDSLRRVYRIEVQDAHYDFYNKGDARGESRYNWHLVVYDSDVDVHVDDALEQEFHYNQGRITFRALGSLWALKFTSKEECRDFSMTLRNKLRCNKYGRPSDQVAETGDESVYSDARSDMNLEEEMPGPMEGLNPEEQRRQDSEDYLKEKIARETAIGMYETPIRGVVIGALTNNYLVRGSRFDVLRNVEGGIEDRHVSFSLTPRSRLGNPGGASTSVLTAAPGITPSRVMLANNESKMNLLTPDRPNSMFRADVEAQKIVSTWNFDMMDQHDIPMKDIVHERKGAQLEHCSTFLAFNEYHLCRLDARVPDGIVQEINSTTYLNGKKYSQKQKMTCIVAAGDGRLAVGLSNGEIRLYSRRSIFDHGSLNRAMNTIKSDGGPITSLDITYDGKWILATTNKYIKLVKTTFNNGKDTDGFSSQFKGLNTMPHVLRLKSEDKDRMGDMPFQKAKFTWVTEQGFKERLIVANCGEYLVLWNFNRVARSAADVLVFDGMPANMEYTLKLRDATEVHAGFQHTNYTRGGYVSTGGAHSPLVVTTPHRVAILGQ